MPMPSFGELEILREDCVDAGPGYLYRYETFEFRRGDASIRARSYKDEPLEVHFLGKSEKPPFRPLENSDFEGKLFREALAFLRSEGKVTYNYLTAEGYVPIPATFTQTSRSAV